MVAKGGMRASGKGIGGELKEGSGWCPGGSEPREEIDLAVVVVVARGASLISEDP